MGVALDMKRTSRKGFKTAEEIPETDFSHGVRGKYAAALKTRGYTIRVYKSGGSFKERRVEAERTNGWLHEPKF